MIGTRARQRADSGMGGKGDAERSASTALGAEGVVRRAHHRDVARRSRRRRAGSAASPAGPASTPAGAPSARACGSAPGRDRPSPRASGSRPSPRPRCSPVPPLPRSMPSPTGVSTVASGAPSGEPTTSRFETTPSRTEEPLPIVEPPGADRGAALGDGDLAAGRPRGRPASPGRIGRAPRARRRCRRRPPKRAPRTTEFTAETRSTTVAARLICVGAAPS